MRRAVLIPFVALAFLAAGPAEAQAPVTAVGVAEREFYITAYRRSVPAGAVRFNVRNYGEDAHNLVVRGPSGFSVRSPDIRAGQRFTLEARLRRRGTYLLLCTKADHVRRGMTTRLRVR